jgi:hypothetical protein
MDPWHRSSWIMVGGFRRPSQQQLHHLCRWVAQLRVCRGRRSFVVWPYVRLPHGGDEGVGSAGSDRNRPQTCGDFARLCGAKAPNPSGPAGILRGIGDFARPWGAELQTPRGRPSPGCLASRCQTSQGSVPCAGGAGGGVPGCLASRCQTSQGSIPGRHPDARRRLASRSWCDRKAGQHEDGSLDRQRRLGSR